MKERKEEINLGLREYLCFANILFIFVYHMCDFFLSKYINSLSQTVTELRSRKTVDEKVDGAVEDHKEPGDEV